MITRHAARCGVWLAAAGLGACGASDAHLASDRRGASTKLDPAEATAVAGAAREPAAAPAQATPPTQVGRRGSGAREMESDDAPAVRPPWLPRTALDQALAAGPGWLLSQVPLQPLRNRDRSFGGFRIVSVFGDDPRALAYGVRPGDVLVKLQGQRIVTPGDLMTAFQRLNSTREVVVELQRDGAPLSLTWPVTPAVPGTGLP